MTSACTYTYEIDLAGVLGVVTRARTPENTVQGFLSVDPLTASYPMLTPYQFASNTPIQAIDLDGLEAVYYRVDENGGRVIIGKADYATVIMNSQPQALDNYPNPIPYVTAINPAEVWVNVDLLDFERLIARRAQSKASNAQAELNRKKALHSNPFWNMYQLSPFVDAVDVYKGYESGGLRGAAIPLVIALLPEAVEPFARGISRGFRHGIKNADEYYRTARNLEGGYRETIASYRETALSIADANGWTYNRKVSKQQDRIFFEDPETGNLFGLDTQHGTFEVHNKKGKHQFELDFSGKVEKERNSDYDFKR